MKKFITIFTFFAITYFVSFAFFLFTKEVQAQGVSCFGGTGTCMFTGCQATDVKVQNDPACGSGVLCCIPTASETTDTCVLAGGTCTLSCNAPSINKGAKSDCGTGQVCCVPTVVQQPSDNGEGLGGLVKCGTGDTSSAATECDFKAFMELIQRVINFMLFVLALPFAALSFAWAGWLYMSAAGNTANVSKAHEIFWDVGKGLFFAFGAWLAIHAIVAGLGVSETYNFLGS